MYAPPPENFNIANFQVGGHLDKAGTTHHSNSFPSYYTIQRPQDLYALRTQIIRNALAAKPSYGYLSEHAPIHSRLFLDIDVHLVPSLHMSQDVGVIPRLQPVGPAELEELLQNIHLKLARMHSTTLQMLTSPLDLAPFTESPEDKEEIVWRTLAKEECKDPLKFDPWMCIVTARPQEMSPSNSFCNFQLTFPWIYCNREGMATIMDRILHPGFGFYCQYVDTAPLKNGFLRSIYQARERNSSLVYDYYGVFFADRFHYRATPEASRVLGYSLQNGQALRQPLADSPAYNAHFTSSFCRFGELFVDPELLMERLWSLSSILPDVHGAVTGKPAPEDDRVRQIPRHLPAPVRPPPVIVLSDDEELEMDPYADSRVRPMEVDGSEVSGKVSEKIPGPWDIDRKKDLHIPLEDPDFVTEERLWQLFDEPDPHTVREAFARHFMCQKVDDFDPHLLNDLMTQAAERERGTTPAKVGAAKRIATLYINRFAAMVVCQGNQLPIYVRSRDAKCYSPDYTVFSEKSFRQWFGRGDTISIDEEKKSTSVCGTQAWLTHPSRLSFEGVEMVERKDQSTFKLNIWSGLRFSKSDCAKWRDFKMLGEATGQVFSVEQVLYHIYKWLCHGDIVLYTYFIDWLASVVQHPLVKTRVSILFSSEEGIGKGVIMQAICNVFGPRHSVTISNPRDLTGDFAGYLERKVLLVFDEIDSLSRAEGSKLKALITDSTLRAEEKFQTARFVSNHLNMVFNTNRKPTNADNLLMEIGPQNRRNLLIECDSRINIPGAAEYFKDLVQYLDADNQNGGRGSLALAAYLFDVDISEFSPTPCPITQLTIEAKLTTAGLAHQWWHLALCNRDFKWGAMSIERMPLNMDKETETWEKSTIFDAFRKWCHDQSITKVPTDTGFWMAIRDVCTVGIARPTAFDGSRPRRAKLPSLLEMRRQFQNYYRGVDFKDISTGANEDDDDEETEELKKRREEDEKKKEEEEKEKEDGKWKAPMTDMFGKSPDMISSATLSRMSRTDSSLSLPPTSNSSSLQTTPLAFQPDCGSQFSSQVLNRVSDASGKRFIPYQRPY